MPIAAIAEHSALIVVDLQQGTLAQPLSTPGGEVLARSVELLDSYRAAGQSVVLVRATALPPGRTVYAAGARAMPEGWDTLAPELGAGPHDIRIDKSGWGAFTGTDLHEQLQARGVTQTVIVGLATSFGVESTARSAYDLGYDVVVVADAIADRSQDAHTASTIRVFPALAEVATTAEVLAAAKVG